MLQVLNNDWSDRRGSVLKFRLVTEQPDLFAIADEWRALMRESDAPEAMMDPDWLLHWWRHYGAGVEPAVGLLYDDGELVGLAPLCIRPYVYRFGLVFRRLQFMGVDANEKDGVCSEYMGFVARRGYEEVVVNRFVQSIARGGFGSWHEVVLSAIRSDSPMLRLLRSSLARAGLSADERVGMVGYFVPLPRTWDGYLQSLSSSRRYRIRNSLAKFEEWAKDKGWKLERADSPESFKAGFDALIDLHEERWRSEGTDGVFSSPRFTAFHRDYIEAMGPMGKVELCWLTVGGAPVAAIYVFRNGKKLLAYQYGRVTGLPTRVRVGIVINALMIKDAIERGDEEFDFLGGESRYKVDMGTGQRTLTRLRVARPTAREYLRLGMINARDRFVAAMKAREALRAAKTATDDASSDRARA